MRRSGLGGGGGFTEWGDCGPDCGAEVGGWVCGLGRGANEEGRVAGMIRGEREETRLEGKEVTLLEIFENGGVLRASKWLFYAGRPPPLLTSACLLTTHS